MKKMLCAIRPFNCLSLSYRETILPLSPCNVTLYSPWLPWLYRIVLLIAARLRDVSLTIFIQDDVLLTAAKLDDINTHHHCLPPPKDVTFHSPQAYRTTYHSKSSNIMTYCSQPSYTDDVPLTTDIQDDVSLTTKIEDRVSLTTVIQDDVLLFAAKVCDVSLTIVIGDGVSLTTVIRIKLYLVPSYCATFYSFPRYRVT